ncbi:metallophosphoesterase [Halosimplex aquaticum]|uniref:Metallophosphoesterase n=1 Tax=Halosimplex aquaticum TaxID=3026162 RepID=A0ABD5XZ49_9EURY|nr:metallophosphoesterase [Halosimplex aquaticum]
MIELSAGDSDAVPTDARDGVDGLDADAPRIVSVSDLHGYLGDARRALTTLGDHPDYDPLVEADDEGRLHWAAGDESVLVVNGDLVDRGPDNEGVIELVERLAREAPPGHVRVTLGNHEWGVLFRDLVNWEAWFSGQRTDAERRQLCEAVERGGLVAAYEGYNFTYAHAGLVTDYEAADLNDRLVDAALELRETVGASEDADTQRRLVDDYRRVLGLGRQSGRGFGAGVAWLDFQFLPGNAQPQIVGHTRQDEPVQKGNVVCENVIRANRSADGGQAVLVETPESLVSLARTGDGGVERAEFDLPETTH